ncbi:HAD-IA family hydrolase [Pseudolysinimonas sp.]|uniref:HAD-IA family hydrolase n=1 Tax=Pseudolysinimonas sp. TaxID=2680009 RepID=UPI003F7DDEBC
MCYSHELGVAKPDPGAFAHVLDRMNAEPGEVLFIDDAAPNVDAARELGLRAHRHRDDAETIAMIRAAVAQRP